MTAIADVAPDLRVDAARDVQAALVRRGLHILLATCIHTPQVPGCPPCTEVALRIALAQVQEVRADWSV